MGTLNSIHTINKALASLKYQNCILAKGKLDGEASKEREKKEKKKTLRERSLAAGLKLRSEV